MLAAIHSFLQAGYLGADRQAQWGIQAPVDGLVLQSKNAAGIRPK